MDRMEVCGTSDEGSIPSGRTYWRVGRVVDGARFESELAQAFRGSNPLPSAKVIVYVKL